MNTQWSASFEEGRAAYLVANYAKAETAFLRAQQLSSSFPERDRRRIATELSVAALYKTLARHEEALVGLAALLEAQESTEPSPDLAKTLYALGVVYVDARRFHEAEPLLLRALDLQERLLGIYHKDVALTLNSLGEAARGLQRTREAEQYFIRALEICGHLDSSGVFVAAIVQNNLGLLYQQLHRDGEAENRHLRAISLSKKQSGRGNPNAARFGGDLGELYLRLGQCDRALPLLRQAEAVSSRNLPEQHPEVLESKSSFADARHRCTRQE